MGVVHRARHRGLDREVALKVLRAGALATDEERERFVIEARAAARLRHPNVVGVHDVGEDGQGRLWLAMDLIDGPSLADRVDSDGPLEPREAARLVAKLARALAYAHARGVIHRDVKPANVLLAADGEPLLADFGLARAGDADGETANDAAGRLTRPGQVLGTPSFMAPEQAAGEPAAVDGRADVWAAGATLYHALTGRPPFVGPSLPAILAAVRDRDPPRPTLLRPGLDPALEAVCLLCLEKAPGDRYRTAAALARDLERFLDGEPVHARPPSLVRRGRRFAARHLGALAAIAATALAIASAVAVLLAVDARRTRAERARTERARDAALDALGAVVGAVEGTLAEETLDEAGRRRAREALLLAARDGYERLLADASADAADAPAALVDAHAGLGRLALATGDAAAAADAFDRAVDAARRLEDDDGDRVLVRTLTDAADASLDAGRLERARALVEEAIALGPETPEAGMVDRLFSGDAAPGSAAGENDDDEAMARQVDAFEQAMLEATDDHVRALGVLGRVRASSGDPAAADEAHRAAIAHARGASLLLSGSTRSARRRAVARVAAGALQRRASALLDAIDAGDEESFTRDEAIGALEEAVVRLRPLAKREGSPDADRAALATALVGLGRAHRADGGEARARVAIAEARALRRSLLATDPTNPRRRADLDEVDRLVASGEDDRGSD